MKSFVAICLLFAVAVDSACIKNLLPSLISAPVATNVAIPAGVGVNSAAINLANLAALGYGIEPVVGLAPAAAAGISFGLGPAVKFGAGLPIINVPGYGAIAI